MTPPDVPRVSGVFANTYETWMEHEVDRAGYAQTHRASLSNVHMRQRCVRPTVRAGVTDIDARSVRAQLAWTLAAYMRAERVRG